MARKLSKQTLGFGFEPLESEHHFIVHFNGKKGDVLITEHFTSSYLEAENPQAPILLHGDDGTLKVTLNRVQWECLATPVRLEFNQRLRQWGLKAGSWQGRQVPLMRTLGKELTMLAWAVESVDTALIETALTNWRGLSQEERWWLYTMTNAASGKYDQALGWRKALRYALTENPHEEKRIQDKRRFTLNNQQTLRTMGGVA
jgi:hypothetical protein